MYSNCHFCSLSLPFARPFLLFLFLSFVLFFFQEKAPFDMEQLVHSTVTTFHSSLRGKNLQLILNMQHLDSLLTDNRQTSSRNVLSPSGWLYPARSLHVSEAHTHSAPAAPSTQLLQDSSDITCSSSAQCGTQLAYACALGNCDRDEVRSGVEHKHQVAQQPQFLVVGDQYRLRQVLGNFISNGMYTYSSSCSLHCRTPS